MVACAICWNCASSMPGTFGPNGERHRRDLESRSRFLDRTCGIGLDALCGRALAFEAERECHREARGFRGGEQLLRIRAAILAEPRSERILAASRFLIRPRTFPSRPSIPSPTVRGLFSSALLILLESVVSLSARCAPFHRATVPSRITRSSGSQECHIFASLA